MAGKRASGKTRQVTPAGRVAWAVTIVIAVLGGGAWAWSALTSGPPASYRATVTGKAVINPATLSVSFRVTNTGKGAGDPSCTVNASDASGAYGGVNEGTLSGKLAPGATTNSAMPVTITSQGARYVTSVKVTCS